MSAEYPDFAKCIEGANISHEMLATLIKISFGDRQAFRDKLAGLRVDSYGELPHKEIIEVRVDILPPEANRPAQVRATG